MTKRIISEKQYQELRKGYNDLKQTDLSDPKLQVIKELLDKYRKKHKLTVDGFNAKYKNFLENGHYGLAINDEDVIVYLDKQFEIEVAHNPKFSYSQIKIKFGHTSVYAQSEKTHTWESEINKMI